MLRSIDLATVHMWPKLHVSTTEDCCATPSGLFLRHPLGANHCMGLWHRRRIWNSMGKRSHAIKARSVKFQWIDCLLVWPYYTTLVISIVEWISHCFFFVALLFKEPLQCRGTPSLLPLVHTGTHSVEILSTESNNCSKNEHAPPSRQALNLCSISILSFREPNYRLNSSCWCLFECQVWD